MDPLRDAAARGDRLESAEEQQARFEREYQERRRRSAEGRQLHSARMRLQRIDDHLLPASEPQMLLLAEFRADAVTKIAALDAQADIPSGREARRANVRSRADLVERIRQIDNGIGSMAEGDLTAMLRQRGVSPDGRSLPLLRQQVAALVEERDRLRRQLGEA